MPLFAYFSSSSKGAVTRGNFFLQRATQGRFKLHFTREIASCNASSLQNNPTADSYNNLHMSTILQEPAISFSPKFAFQVARKNCLVLKNCYSVAGEMVLTRILEYTYLCQRLVLKRNGLG